MGLNDKTQILVEELKGLKDQMVENLDKIIERDGKIEVIMQKAESLSSFSKTYKSNVRNKARLYHVLGQESQNLDEK